MKHAILALFLLTSCSGVDAFDQPYTWGDASRSIAQSFCAALNNCVPSTDIAVCEEHVRFHLCETAHSCDVERDRDVAEAAEAECAAAIEQRDCFLILFGVLPAGCHPLLRLDPRLDGYE